MHRRTLLSAILGGSTLLAGCNTPLSTGGEPQVYNPTGSATIRPLGTPFVRTGIDSKSDQYLYARMFRPGDTLSVTNESDAQQYSESVANLSRNQFAVLTNLRTAASAPAYFWPTETEWQDNHLQVKLKREVMSPTDSGEEVVGVALTAFEVDGKLPEGASVVFPGGATIAVGTNR